MRSFCARMSSRLLVLLCIHVNLKYISSFSPTLAINRHVAAHINKIINNPNDRRQKLYMATGSITNEVPAGKIVVIRHLYRFSPTHPSVETKYAIEERQYFAVGQDRSLEPFGDKSIIFRGNESFDQNGGVAKVGSALYTLQGLKDGGSVLESCYAMALFSMEHPQIVGGKGLEIGSGVGLGGILSSIGAGIATGSREKVSPDGELEAPVPNSLSKIMLTDANEGFLKTCISNLVSTSFPASNVELASLAWDQRVPSKLQDNFDFIIGCDTIDKASVVEPMADIVANCLKSPYSSDGIMAGSLVYIAPRQRESIGNLETKLEWGYGMNTKISDFALERIDLTPLVIDDVNTKQDYDGYAEFKNINRRKFSVLSNFDPHKNIQNNVRSQSDTTEQSTEGVTFQPANPTTFNSSGASYLDHLGGGVSLGKPAPPLASSITGGPQSYTDQLNKSPMIKQPDTSEQLAKDTVLGRGGATTNPGFGEGGSHIEPANPATFNTSGASYLDYLGGGVSLGKPAPPLVSFISRGPQSYTDQLNKSAPITFTHSRTNFFSGEGSAMLPSSPATPSHTSHSTGSSSSGTALGPGNAASQVTTNYDSSTNIPTSSTGGMSYLDQFSGGVALGKPAPPIQTSDTGGPPSYTDQLSSGFSEFSNQPQPEIQHVSSDTPENLSSTSASWQPPSRLSENELRELEKSVEATVEKSVEAILRDLGYQ